MRFASVILCFHWLDYSASMDRAYCFTFFLFRGPTKKGAVYKSFVVDGYNCWNNRDRLNEDVGEK
jgi:hypothetical protein